MAILTIALAALSGCADPEPDAQRPAPADPIPVRDAQPPAGPQYDPYGLLPGGEILAPPPEDPLPTPRVETLLMPSLARTPQPRAETPYRAPVPVRLRPIEEPAEDQVLRGMLVEPEGIDPAGAVLLVPEWWGLNEAMIEEARILGSWGFLTLAFDLYDGAVAETRAEASALARSLDRQEALRAMSAAAGWLAGEATTDTLAVAVVGWNWGATLALALAGEEPRLGAAALINPSPIVDQARLEPISAPLLVFFTTSGGWITPAEATGFARALEQAGVDHAVIRYTMTPQALLDPQTAAERSYRDTARRRLREFLDDRLD